MNTHVPNTQLQKVSAFGQTCCFYVLHFFPPLWSIWKVKNYILMWIKSPKLYDLGIWTSTFICAYLMHRATIKAHFLSPFYTSHLCSLWQFRIYRQAGSKLKSFIIQSPRESYYHYFDVYGPRLFSLHI